MNAEPNSRIEHYLDAIANGETPEIEPVSRLDHYVAKIAGMDVTLPEPVTRIEEHLAAIAESGGGGGGSYTYVVPEQTVTLPESTSSGKRASIQVNESALSETAEYIFKAVVDGGSEYRTYSITMYVEEEYEGETSYYFTNDGSSGFTIDKTEEDGWGIAPDSGNESKTITITGIVASDVF